MNTLYTAVGKFESRSNGGSRYPVILLGSEEYLVDIQEMLLWTALNWRFWSMAQLECDYAQRARESGLSANRSFEQCVSRLLQRGLIASGTGETGEDALYDLLNSLYIIPTCCNLATKLLSFLKLTFCDGLPIRITRRVFYSESLTAGERRVVDLAKQSLLSTAEIIKCVDKGAYDLTTNRKVMDVLYDDDTTTCDNIGVLAKHFENRQPVVLAVANLYLHKQIILERV